jgi:threonine/homoserine/homoserine lactone efflux protein
MQNSVKIIGWGILISFLGSLPPGHMTIAASYIAGQQGAEPAFIYSLGSMLAEVVIVRAGLAVINKLASKYKVFFILEIITAVLLIAMTAGCFYLSAQLTDYTEAKTYQFSSPFTAGFLISIVNPIHIPFWLGWSIFLMDKNILTPRAGQYNFYVAGIGAGSMLGFIVFICGGEWVLNHFSENQGIILLIFGLILLMAAFLHIRKMIIQPASVRFSNIFKRRE